MQKGCGITAIDPILMMKGKQNLNGFQEGSQKCRKIIDI